MAFNPRALVGLDFHGLKATLTEDDLVVEPPNCKISFIDRPGYCDRGRYGCLVSPNPGQFKIHIDGADGFPRYFFNLQRAIDEAYDWAQFNKQAP